MTAKFKTSYKVKNWSEYNESLVRRGDITFWFREDVIDAWEHENDEPKMGRPFTYSDTAIECLLVLRELFRLPYRQTEGLGRSLVQLMHIELAIPDFTSLAKRAAQLGISLAVARGQGPIDVVVDSTGLKVFGEGEWKMRGARQKQAPHVAEAASGGQSSHPGNRSGTADGEQRARCGPSRGSARPDAFESVNSVIRKFTKYRKIYPNEESALKLVYMAIHEASKKWTRPIHHWKQALNHFAVLYEGRLPQGA